MAKEKAVTINRDEYVIADNVRHATATTEKHGKLGMLYKGDEIPETITDEQISDLLTRKLIMTKKDYKAEIEAKEKAEKEKFDARPR